MMRKPMSQTTSLRGGAVPDYIYWMLFVVFTAVHYYTKTQGTAQEGLITFFIIVWLASFLVLLALKVYAREGRSEIVDYDENLQRWHIDYIIAGLLGEQIWTLTNHPCETSSFWQTLAK